MIGVGATSARRGSLWWLWLGVWLAYLLTAGGTLATTDASATFALARSIADHGRVDVPRDLSLDTWRGTDGRYYLPFGIGQALYDIPFLVVGRMVLDAAGVPAARQEPFLKAGVALASTLSASLCVVATAALAWRFCRDRRAAFVAGLIAAFATPLWPYAKFGFSAPLVAATLAGGVHGMAAGVQDERPHWVLAGGALLGAALLVRHEAVLAAGAALAWLAFQPGAWRMRVRRVATASIGPAVAALGSVAYNVARFGDPLRTGHTPDVTWRGAWGLVASPSGSILVFAPFAAVGVVALASGMRRRQPLAWLVACVAGALVLFYASLDDYLGTRSYGPRYLVPLVPLVVASTAAWAGPGTSHAWRKRAMLAVAWVSLLVQVPAVLVDFSRAGIAAGRPAAAMRVTAWRWSPLWITTRAATRAVPENLRYLTGLEQRPRIDRGMGDGSLAAGVSFSLDFWWLYAWYLGLISRATALAIATALAAASAACLALGWHSTAVSVGAVPG